MKHQTARYWSPGAAGPLLGDDPPWQEAALCAQADPEAWFPEKGQPTLPAKTVCRSCPVTAECLEYALANDERFGVWGGLSERERRRLKRGEASGEPSAAPAARQVLRLEDGSKRCSRCREVKSPGEFHNAAATPDGLTYWCKACARASQLEHRRKSQPALDVAA
jgi:hypothetical protein